MSRGAPSRPRSDRRGPGAGGRELRDHVAAVAAYWRSAVACVLLCVAGAVALTAVTAKTYESSATYFAATAVTGDSNALQAEDFAQRRVNSYVGVVTSERMAREVLADTDLDLTPAEISGRISASVEPETVLLNVSVRDTSPQRSLLIARAVARNLDATVAALDGGRRAPTVSLDAISGPTLATGPVSPKPVLNVAAGLLFGLALGIAQAVLRRQLDTTVRTREELYAVTRHPVLALINRDPAVRQSPVMVPGTTHSRRAESFRQLRTSLRFVDAADRLDVVVVTSSVESEGKTTTSTNLAVSFAEAGHQVLLIDGDLRKPKLEDYLDLEASAGLTSILIGDVDFDDVVQEWGDNGLQVLACGPVPPNPSELLGSPGMDKLLNDLRSRFDLIVIDSPPLLPVTDAAVLATYASGAILVVRHGSTRSDQIEQAIDALEAVDSHVLGSVLTMVPDTRRDRQPAYYRETEPSDRATTS